MRIYAITIKPQSPFGTPLKGDTIFGQFCWLAGENSELLTADLSHWIGCYHERPFAVFSSAWPKIHSSLKGSPQVDGDRGWIWAMRRPELPQAMLGEPEPAADCATRLKNRKTDKKRKWLLVEQDQQVVISRDRLLDDKDLYRRLLDTLPVDEQRRLRLIPDARQQPMSMAEQQHNTINRLTMTTGKGEFAPYVSDNIHFMPGMELVIFAGLDDEAGDDTTLRRAFTMMGQWGFGRDASTGLGRFELTGIAEVIPAATEGADACLTLGPCLPVAGSCRVAYFKPFVRFGRHGAQILHTGRPFKNPVVMADEGAVLLPHEFPTLPYLGRAVAGISKAQPEAVCQGYSLYLPLRLPVPATGGDHE